MIQRFLFTCDLKNSGEVARRQVFEKTEDFD